MVKNHIATTSLYYRACALLLAVSIAGSPVIAAAGSPTIPGFYGAVRMPNAPAAGTLPVLLPGGALSGATVGSPVGNTLTINQTQSQATIDWKSFNLAPDSVVIFNQKQDGVAQPQWAALNRIYDVNPSLIFGNLKADGKVYLINRNGIFFGPGSKVNTHSLIASNFNITDANFKDGKLRFNEADPDHPDLTVLSSDAFISNYGSIATDSGGSVFFVGPNVVNAGTISSPSGKISLVGARPRGDGKGEVEAFALTVDATGKDVSYSDLDKVPGAAYNAESGKLITEAGGRINMYGATVQNDGLIRAVTAFKKGGVVVLAARDRVSTGAGSLIESPIESSTETADPQFAFNHPEVIFRGLSTNDNPSLNPLTLIDHEGAIVAKSGNVTMTASDRVFVGEGSSIDVSGLWLDRPASAGLLQAQLNSVDLRDDYGQKNGTLLGQKVNVDVLTGSSIGNIRNSYLTMQTGAEERSTVGGSISFSDPTSQVTLKQLIVKQGAQLDFSGGGVRYAGGTMATSHLISGNSVYAIGSAPQWLSYDRLADSQTKTYQRFGVSEQFGGLFYGGGSSVQDLVPGRVVGSNAGSTLFNAQVAVLDGTLTGNVTRGQYQTGVTPYAVKDSNATDYQNYAISVTRGLEGPAGGTVTVGQLLPAAPSAATNDNEQSFVTGAIDVRPTTATLEANFGVNSTLDRETTVLSAALLNQAGLSSLNLFANTTINTDPGAAIALLPGGSYLARTRNIDFAGSVVVPGGSVEMTTRPDVTSYQALVTKPGAANPLFQSLPESIHLEQGSRISTAGEQIDNSAAGIALHPVTAASHTSGGTILIQERNEQGTSQLVGTSSTGNSLVVSAGSQLDVSGGWLIDAKGKIAGGNAGTLDLAGPTLSLAGELRGFALPGSTGGQINLHAGEVQVTARDQVFPSNMPIDRPEQPIPDYLLGKLVLGENRLKDTGFTRINLIAINDVSFSDGAVLTPSLARLPLPVPELASQSTRTGNLALPPGSDPTAAAYLGPTAVTLSAGKDIYESSPLHGGGDATNSTTAKIDLPAGTGVTVAPGGSVTLVAPSIDIAGRIEALGGNVTATARYGSLVLETGAEILAGGYQKPVTTTVAGLPAGSIPQAGGKVSLTSVADVVLKAGSLVDVSGSAPVERIIAGTAGAPVKIVSAGDSGTLSLSYAGTLALDGEIDGKARMNGVQGGTLSVTNSAHDLNILKADIDLYQGSGFDALAFASYGSLIFPEALDLSVGRSITLNSKLIQGAPDVDVTLRAPWIQVLNTSSIPASGSSSTSGTGSLTLKADGGFIDVQGSIQVGGFRDLTLQAGRDLRLTDQFYSSNGNNKWAGYLGVAGDLTLQASRIYPTTATDFTISAPGTSARPGKVTILAGAADPTPVYSAGGSLTIYAPGGIDHRGALVAPQGSITLDGGADGRVFLAQGSSIVTSGSVPVDYGNYDGSTWTVKATNINVGSVVGSAPAGSVTLNGDEVVVNQGAVLDVSGGGSIYSTSFQPGIPGTLNPLTVTSPAPRYVVVPDNSVHLPGAAVYLDAAPAFGLKAGFYSLLPADKFAFVPGALVIQDTGIPLVSGQKALSPQGYQVVAGYKTVADTSIGSLAYEGYSIRTASDVIREGDFTSYRSFTSGNGGNLTLNAATSAVMNGTLIAQPLQGYQGGTLTLSAKNVVVQSSAVPLPDGFNFDSAMSEIAALPAGTLIVDTASVSNKGFGEVVLGSQNFDLDNKPVDSTVTVKSGTRLQASSITLQANTGVTMEKGALVEATGDGTSGNAAVDVANGTFYLEENALVHASNRLHLDVGGMSLKGSFKSDHGLLSLAADNIVFAADNYVQQTVNAVPQNVYLTKDNWTSMGLSDYVDTTLVSRGDLSFQQGMALSVKGALTLDAGRYVTASPAVDASFSAGGKLSLLNSGAAATSQQGVDNKSSLSFSAAGIDISPRSGGIVFDRFGTVTLDSSRDVTLRGAGAVQVAGDLNIDAPRVTTSYYKYDADPGKKGDVSIPYTAAEITIDAGGKVSLAGNGGSAGTSSTPGGSLEIKAASIAVGDPTGKHETILETPAGQLKLTASGDVSILDKSSVLATGFKSPAPMQPDVYSYTPGGQILVQSSSGAINLASGSTLDVSASDLGDAGSVALSAAGKGVTMAGSVKGSAAKGQGGSFTIDSAKLDGVGGLDGLSSTLSNSGFNNQINIRSRAGDLFLSAGKTLTGREIVVAADGAALSVGGAIKADTTDGSGRIELYAGKALTLQDGSKLSATGTADGANGGTVILSSQDGSDNSKTFNGVYAVNVNKAAAIAVGGKGGKGGTVDFRAYQGKKQAGDPTLNDVNMGAVSGTITGASRISVEGVKAYADQTTVGGKDSYISDAESFISDASTAGTKNRLFGTNATDPLNHLQAGIEISSAAEKNLILDQAWDLSKVRPGGEAGVLTLRAGGNLSVNQNLSDAPTPMATLYGDKSNTVNNTMKDSWGINLVAGADAGAANYKAAVTGNPPAAGTGNLTVAIDKAVYSENAPITFAAGNDAVLSGWSGAVGPGYMINAAMQYNLGSYGGSVRGTVGKDLNLVNSGSAIQTALGSIDIRVAGDLNLGTKSNTGAIRTTGEYEKSTIETMPGSGQQVAAGTTSYWTYRDGGSIKLDVGGAVAGNLEATNGWDGAYVDQSVAGNNRILILYPWYLAAGFGGKENANAAIQVTVGIATMGGGDISVRTGGSLLTQIGLFGTRDTGNLKVTSGGDMIGRFRVMDGSATLISGGGFGKDDLVTHPTWRSVIEMADAQVSVAAQGEVDLGAVLNPDNSRDRLFFGNVDPKDWNMTYSRNAGAEISSLAGNLTFYGTDRFSAYNFTGSSTLFSSLLDRQRILPASFTLSAAGDLDVRNDFYLAPSAAGNLRLYAGRDLNGAYTIAGTGGGAPSYRTASFKSVDVDVDSFYGRESDSGGQKSALLRADSIIGGSSVINHLTDPDPVVVTAGGNIDTIKLMLNKPALITAQGDINMLDFIGQNVGVNPITIVSAKGSIDQGIILGTGNNPSEIKVGGPGTLLVEAGANINLGNSKGIESTGNSFNSAFTGADTDSNIIVSAGAKQRMLPADAGAGATDLVLDYFATLRQAGDDYSLLKAAGKNDEALRRIEEAQAVVRKYFDAPAGSDGTGKVTMVDSLIRSKKGDIYFMARSDVNVGRSNVSDSAQNKQDTGITTTFGGRLNIYTGGDLNVNESRTMTFLGGENLVWKNMEFKGGDIIIWSDQGNINAGRGSKTALSSPEAAKPTFDPVTGVLISLLAPAPALGSGVRASTYDPDGSTGPIQAPEPGDIYLFAPKGIIDAGEAGIAGGKVTLGATQVLNVKNIAFSAGSVGVPTSTDSSVSLGSLAGNSNLTDSSKMIEQASTLGAVKDKAAAQTAAVDDFMSRWLDLRIISFDGDSDAAAANDEDAKKEKERSKKNKK